MCTFLDKRLSQALEITDSQITDSLQEKIAIY